MLPRNLIQNLETDLSRIKKRLEIQILHDDTIRYDTIRYEKRREEKRREEKRREEKRREEKRREEKRREASPLPDVYNVSMEGTPPKRSCLSHKRLFISFALSEALLRDLPWLMFNEGADTTFNSVSVYLRQIPRAPSNWSHNESLLTVNIIENNNHQGRWKKVHKREQQS